MIKFDVLNYCPNYYAIQNFGFNEDDHATATLIDNYERFIFTADAKNNETLDKVTKLDLSIGRYVSDFDYRKAFVKDSSIFAATSQEALTEFADKAIKFFEEYQGDIQGMRRGNWI